MHLHSDASHSQTVGTDLPFCSILLPLLQLGSHIISDQLDLLLLNTEHESIIWTLRHQSHILIVQIALERMNYWSCDTINLEIRFDHTHALALPHDWKILTVGSDDDWWT